MISNLPTSPLYVDLALDVTSVVEEVVGIPVYFGTLIPDLELKPEEVAGMVEACFLKVMPEYEWTAADMREALTLEYVEELITFFEDLVYGGGPQKVFTFNF